MNMCDLPEGLFCPAGSHVFAPPKVDGRPIPQANEVSRPLLVGTQLRDTERFTHLLPTGVVRWWRQAILTHRRVESIPHRRDVVRQCVKTHLT
jgi:hypothetical protein